MAPKIRYLVARTCFLLLLAVLFVLSHRYLQLNYQPDSPEYREFTGLSIFSGQWWSTLVGAGGRAFTTPVVFWALGNDQRVVWFQAALSFLAWTTFAAAVASHLRPPVLKVAAFVYLCTGMFDRNVLLWNWVLLSESLSLSLFLLLLAAMLRADALMALRRGSFFLLLPLLYGAALFASSTRDTNAYILPFLGLALVASAWSAWRGRVADPEAPLRWLILTGVLAAVCVTQLWNNQRGIRYPHAIDHVIQRRIYKRPEFTDYFVQRGLPPYSDQRCEFDAEKVNRVEECSTLKPLYNSWLRSEGKREYGRFLLAHPHYSFVETAPLVWDMIHMDLFHYLKATKVSKALGKTSKWFWPLGAWQYLLLGLGAFAFALLSCQRGAPRSGSALSLTALGCAMVLAGLFNIWLNYHADAIEVERHALLAQLLTRLGFVLVFLGEWNVWLNRNPSRS